jgi:hypothetical protein
MEDCFFCGPIRILLLLIFFKEISTKTVEGIQEISQQKGEDCIQF